MDGCLIRLSERLHVLLPTDKNAGGKWERFRAVEPLVAGKDVLDVGGAAGWRREDWIHRQIAGVATSVRGVDLNAQAVAEAQGQGFDFVCGDIAAVAIGK